jgi:hypothetical protein
MLQHATALEINGLSDALVSEDGQWVIKQGSPQRYLHACEDKSLSRTTIIQVANQEIGDLKKIGLDVISHGFIEVDSEIVTITPLIEGILNCSVLDFQNYIAPLQLTYYQHAVDRPGTYFMEDIGRSQQFSKLYDDGKPFLHDPEPYLANDELRVKGILRYLSSVAIIR